MRFEITWDDVKCIPFEKYGVLFLESPILVY
jgi:hypothetical protein